MNMNMPTPQLAVLALAALLAGPAAQAETFQNLEAVDANGLSLWPPAFPLAITGVILNDPGEMLDSTPNFLPWNSGANIFQLGGQWQIFVQAVLPGDRGGVECWMGQNYGNLPWLHSSAFSYDSATWSTEVARVSHDPATGRAFRKGDLVTVTANASLFHGGMQNINEQHSIDPAYDFTVSLVSSNYGLPAPETLSLSSLVGTNLSPTGHYDLFDATRATGGEHWQGMRIRLNSLDPAEFTGCDYDPFHLVLHFGEERLHIAHHPDYPAAVLWCDLGTVTLDIKADMQDHPARCDERIFSSLHPDRGLSLVAPPMA